MFEVPSSSNAQLKYKVRMSGKDSAWVCSCPAWKYQKGKPGNLRQCKHIRQVAASLLGHLVATGPTAGAHQTRL